jgi:hypothetical protein
MNCWVRKLLHEYPDLVICKITAAEDRVKGVTIGGVASAMLGSVPIRSKLVLSTIYRHKI